jgi:hypothetical protein
MIRALLLIFDPTATWDRILRVPRGVVSILLIHLLPLLLLTSAWEGYGLIHWGKLQREGLLETFINFSKGHGGQAAHLKKFSLGETVVVETAQVLLSLLVVFAGAKLVKALGETFRGRHTYTQSFTAVAYGLSPLFLLRLFDAFTGISPWASWGIGIALSIAVLYQGLPRSMTPDPSHAFGLYIISSLLLLLITGVARFVTAGYLQGEYPKLLAIVSDLTARLPF